MTDIPSAGQHEIELVNIKDTGLQNTPYDDKEMLLLTFLCLDQRGTNSKYVPLYVRVTKTWAEKSRLRVLAEQIGIKTLEALPRALKAKMRAVITHNTSTAGKIYANLDSIVPGTVRLLAEAPQSTFANSTPWTPRGFRGTDVRNDVLMCPQCGGEYVNFSGDARRGQKADLPALLVPLTCEKGHEFGLVLQARKGNVCLSFEPHSEPVLEEVGL
jgi:hypothetical protein